MARSPRPRRLVAALAATTLAATTFTAALGVAPSAAIPVIAPGSAYRQVNLSSDVPGVAPILDPQMVNPWGLASSASGPLWLANDGTSSASPYQGTSTSTFVRHPSQAAVTVPGGLPTGVVATANDDFEITSGPASGPARFVYASITGNLVGWNPSVPAAGSTTGVIAASHPGHVYTGLAIGNVGSADLLYAADFANGTIDVFDEDFALQPSASFPFADPTIPTTPGNTYHPYNIQAVGSSLYVTYAKVGGGGLDEEGVGNGFVRRFNTSGVRDLTFGINNGPLNSPWGVALAPPTFGIFGGALMIGNNGNGNPSIHAFNPTTGAFLGTLQDESGNGIVIDELWALRFGNGGEGGLPGTLYFTAGLGEEEHGLFGALNPTTATATSLVQFSTDEYSLGEGAPRLRVTVTRNGEVSGPATVRYATWDQSRPGQANQKTDYEMAVGILTFLPGQTSRTFSVLPVNDPFVEGPEDIGLMVANVTGAGVGLGSPATATLRIVDNDAVAPSANPIDDPTFFVRQQYLDFLNRPAEPEGLAYWVGRITACGANATCRSRERVKVSGNFFLSPEFQNGAGAAFRASRAATGRNPLYGEAMVDMSIFKAQGSPGFFDGYVQRPEFVATFGPLSNAQYVDRLIANTGVTFTPSQRAALVNGLNGGTKTRAVVLREVTQNPAFQAAEHSRAFVLSQYFGYLRRSSEPSGYAFWLAELAGHGGDFVQAGMVENFLTSPEYRQRFGTS
ncbi:MAG TPA: TIGR03118 family protein [Acidimicrobiales bacterium]|nr:TIGR03118 family protein [Acidimicrobiales bacterium]